MFLSSYATKYFRDNSALMATVGNRIYHRKCPQPDVPNYIVVGTDQEYDHGNITVNSLTCKQSSFTLLIVGTTPASLQAPYKKLVEAYEACRSTTVESEEMGGSMWIQCLLPEDGSGEMCDGINLEGNELSRPCIIITLRGSYSLPNLG